MRYLASRFSLFILFVLLLGAAQKPTLAEGAEDPGRFNREEIQAAVMSFSDTWGASIYEVSRVLEERIGTPEASEHMEEFRLYGMVAGFDIAAGPYPGVALLDMMVMTALEVIVWEEHWLPRVYGEAARPVLAKLQKLKGYLWGYAESVLTPAQIMAVQELIHEWRARNPDATFVHFIRFSSFGELGRKPSLEAARKAGGLLGPVKEAAQAADEIRSMGDRMMFLMMRMQEIIGARIELVIKSTLKTSEIQGFLKNMDGFEYNAERYAILLDRLPENIAAQVGISANEVVDRISLERQAAINQIASATAIERSATIVQLLDGLTLERQALMSDVSRLVRHGSHTTDQAATRIFVLVAVLLLLYFLMRLMLRYIIDHPSRTFIGTLGVGLTLSLLALLVIAIAMAYMHYTRPEPIEFSVTAPPVRDEIQPAHVLEPTGTSITGSESAVGQEEGRPSGVADESNEKVQNVLTVQALFRSGSIIVDPQFHSALDAVTDLLENDNSLQVEVHGYSDSLGDPAQNLVLSEQRAFAVARYLEESGIDARRLDLTGHGSSNPVAADDTATGRARNRRVEIIVTRTETSVQ